MKVIELSKCPPSLQSLLAMVEREDVILTIDGHAIARLEKFTDEDWGDWLFKHDPKVIREAKATRERLKRCEGKKIDEVAEELGITMSHRRAIK